MIKKLFTMFLVGVITLMTITPVSAITTPEANNVNITAKYAIVMDEETGQILYEKNIHEKMYPASITKILTCIEAINLNNNLDKTVTITQDDLDTVWETGASAANFEVDEVVTYRDVLMGAMLPSGADACRALANNTCGSQEKFVDKMNERVKKLGLKDSHFVNTTGIHDPNHYTTVYDMAEITRYALQNEQFKEVFTRYQYNSSNSRHQWIKKVLYNSKRDHIDTSMIKGCKSGYTSDAKHTLSSLLEIDGRNYVCVVGYCQNDATTNHCTVTDTLALGDYVKNNFQSVTLHKKGDILNTTKVKYGEKTSLDVKAPEDINVVLPKSYNQDNLDYQYKLKSITAPVKKGQNLGTLTIKYKDEEIYKTKLVSTKKVDKKIVASILDTALTYLVPVLKILAVLFVLLLIIRRIMIKRRRRKAKRYKKRY